MAKTLIQICDLPYMFSYDWEAMLAFFRAHQLPHIETVDESSYERVVPMRNGLGWFCVERKASRNALSLSVWNGTEDDLVDIASSVRRMFDLDANPTVLLEAMNRDKALSRLRGQYSGLRLARSWSGFETLFSAVLGQLVSVSFGRVLINELMEAAGSCARHPKTAQRILLFPSADQIINADLSRIRTSTARRKTIYALAQIICSGALASSKLDDGKALRTSLRSVPGIGAWTVEYGAMRGLGDDDAFPATDYALKQELKRHPDMNVKAVRPWRGYAAVTLWRNFAEGKRLS